MAMSWVLRVFSTMTPGQTCLNVIELKVNHLSILASGLREAWELTEPTQGVCVKGCRTLDSLGFT
jgi:hypothetical protein